MEKWIEWMEPKKRDAYRVEGLGVWCFFRSKNYFLSCQILQISFILSKMSLKFIHSADWHLGQTYWGLGAQTTRSRLWRFDAVRRLWQVAAENDAAFVLVAGDVFDSETPSEAVRAQAVELLSEAPCPVYLLPGESDAGAEGSVWFSPQWRSGLTGLNHIHPVLTPEPLLIEGGVTLFPCPVMRRRNPIDATAWLPRADRGENFRIGLAHGYLQNYAPDETRTLGTIAADCCARAGLDYLALGGHHAATSPDPNNNGASRARSYYAGTPEIGAQDDANAGFALRVQIEHPGAVPVVTPQRVGAIELHDLGALELKDKTDWRNFVEQATNFDDPARTIVRAQLRGEVSPALYGEIQVWLAKKRDQLLGVDIAFEQLHPRPSREDFADLKLERLEESVIDGLQGALAVEHLGDLRGVEQIESWSGDPDARREALALYYRLLAS